MHLGARNGLWILVLACSTESGVPDAAQMDTSVSDGSSLDAEPDAGIADARDAAAKDATPADTGPRDLGPCTCSYGFHHQCGAGEVCERGRIQEQFQGAIIGPRDGCTPTQPVRVCDQPGDSRWNPCDALCTTARGRSPCDGVQTRDIVDGWVSLLRPAAIGPNATLRIDAARYESVARIAPPECNEYVFSTLMGVTELCAGIGAVRLSTAGTVLLHEFGPLAAGSCRARVLERCFGLLNGAIGANHELSLQSLVQNPPDCGAEPLPYAPPCDTARGTECVVGVLRAALRSIDPR